MNIANSRALLLSVIVCLFSLSVGAIQIDISHKSNKTKEVIIVNIDSELNDDLPDLAQYTFDLHNSLGDGLVTIKDYQPSGSDLTPINRLVVMLHDLGIKKDQIVLKHVESAPITPYFTVSVTPSSEVQ